MATIPHYIYEFSGSVEGGNRIGRKMGIPTVNIPVRSNDNLPQFGVYAASVLTSDGILLKGIANIGMKPTVILYDEDGNIVPNPVGIEVNIFDFDGDLYDRDITVYFHDFVRPEMKFENFDELKEQIQRDIITTREILSKVYE